MQRKVPIVRGTRRYGAGGRSCIWKYGEILLEGSEGIRYYGCEKKVGKGSAVCPGKGYQGKNAGSKDSEERKELKREERMTRMVRMTEVVNFRLQQGQAGKRGPVCPIRGMINKQDGARTAGAGTMRYLQVECLTHLMGGNMAKEPCRKKGKVWKQQTARWNGANA